MVSVADPSEYRLYYQVTDPSKVEDVEVSMQVSVTYKSALIKGKVVQTPSTAPLVVIGA
jgi:hypothetical protein